MNPWTLLVNGLGSILAFFYSIVPNYGLAIIMLTLAVSLLLFPLTVKQTRSMKAMQEIQPEVKRIQKELKADREEMQKELMALYQERGVNPAGGCLPLILQMPIWFALFSVLRIDVVDGQLNGEAIPGDSALGQALVDGQTSFLSMDLLISPSDAAGISLTTAIPYVILVIVVMAAGFYQQWQTTRRNEKSGNQTEAPQGMQTALKIMPLFFGFISWGFPTGLVLYFATSNLFRIGQQSVILRLDDGSSSSSGSKAKGRGAKDGDLKETSSPSDGGSAAAPPQATRRTGPSPNASKKRKKRRRK